jgi:hypothetical protein
MLYQVKQLSMVAFFILLLEGYKTTLTISLAFILLPAFFFVHLHFNSELDSLLATDD